MQSQNRTKRIRESDGYSKTFSKKTCSICIHSRTSVPVLSAIMTLVGDPRFLASSLQGPGEGSRGRNCTFLVLPPSLRKPPAHRIPFSPPRRTLPAQAMTLRSLKRVRSLEGRFISSTVLLSMSCLLKRKQGWWGKKRGVPLKLLVFPTEVQRMSMSLKVLLGRLGAQGLDGLNLVSTVHVLPSQNVHSVFHHYHTTADIKKKRLA